MTNLKRPPRYGSHRSRINVNEKFPQFLTDVCPTQVVVSPPLLPRIGDGNELGILIPSDPQSCSWEMRGDARASRPLFSSVWHMLHPENSGGISLPLLTGISAYTVMAGEACKKPF